MTSGSCNLGYMENRYYFGRKFYWDKKTGYWISTQYPRIRAHTWVWRCSNRTIPSGFHLHHKDGDKSNNQIENLEIMHKRGHASFHMQDPARRERARQMANKYRGLSAIWHRSPEGRAWHKYHALRHKFGNPDPIEYKCDNCGISFMRKRIHIKQNKFCTNNCKSKHRRKSGLDDITKVCIRCKVEFKSNKYSKVRYCSRRCVAMINFGHDELHEEEKLVECTNEA